MLTADGKEAEVATPPIELASGAAALLEGYLWAGMQALTTALPDGMRLAGYSTHLSVSCDDRVVVRAARLYAERLAPAMMIMIDRSKSPGLLVRTRRSRLEFGGEYAEGRALRVAATFAAATALLCERAARSRTTRRGLPAGGWEVQSARERHGWYVDRTAFGCDLYAGGRAAIVAPKTSAQSMLEEVWARARPHVEGVVDDGEIDAVDRAVDGLDPLPLELSPDAPDCEPPVVPEPGPHGDLLGARSRPAFVIRPVIATWDVVVFELKTATGRIAFRPVHASEVGRFLAELDAGLLDRALETRLARSPRQHVLTSLKQLPRGLRRGVR